jgi:hypothetical protein
MNSPTQRVPPRKRRFGAPRNWRQPFLANLADTSNVSAAAEAAQISLSWVYKTRREDAQFARQWFAALCEGYDNLEMDLLHRLRSGEAKEADPRKYDNATAFRLLSVHRQSVAREKAIQEDDDEQAILSSIDAKLDAMRERAQQNAAVGEPDDEE